MYLSFQFSEFLIITEKVLEIQRIRFGRFFTKTKTHQAINFPKAPLKIPFVDQRLRKIYQWIRRDLDCVRWCERKTLHLGGQNQSERDVLFIYNGMRYHSSNFKSLIFFD